jgi:hypothetical protein
MTNSVSESDLPSGRPAMPLTVPFLLAIAVWSTGVLPRASESQRPLPRITLGTSLEFIATDAGTHRERDCEPHT